MSTFGMDYLFGQIIKALDASSADSERIKSLAREILIRKPSIDRIHKYLVGGKGHEAIIGHVSENADHAAVPFLEYLEVHPEVTFLQLWPIFLFAADNRNVSDNVGELLFTGWWHSKGKDHPQRRLVDRRMRVIVPPTPNAPIPNTFSRMGGIKQLEFLHMAVRKHRRRECEILRLLEWVTVPNTRRGGSFCRAFQQTLVALRESREDRSYMFPNGYLEGVVSGFRREWDLGQAV